LTTFLTFFILIVLASCGYKYYGTNFIYAVPTSLLIAPSLRTIQLLFKLYITRKQYLQISLYNRVAGAVEVEAAAGAVYEAEAEAEVAGPSMSPSPHIPVLISSGS
jgi:hypothetical protein